MKNIKLILIFCCLIVCLLYIIQKQNTAIRNLKDSHVTEIYQRDSLNRVYELNNRELKQLITKNDSVYAKVLKDKDIKIKELSNITKVVIEKPIIIKDTIKVSTSRDTTLEFIRTKECATIVGKINIINNNANIILESINIKARIDIINYVDTIHWYNFRKRKQYGFSTIGFRNHYISKVAVESDYLKGKDIKVTVYKRKL